MRARCFRFALMLLISGSVWVSVAAQAQTCPTAFARSGALEAAAFFETHLQPGYERLRWFQVPPFVRDAIRHLGKQTQLPQVQKAEFWEQLVTLLKRRADVPFDSDRFEGSDGSILFQGSGTGAWLVLHPTGSVYRGYHMMELPLRVQPRPIWQADYTDLRKID